MIESLETPFAEQVSEHKQYVEMMHNLHEHQQKLNKVYMCAIDSFSSTEGESLVADAFDQLQSKLPKTDAVEQDSYSGSITMSNSNRADSPQSHPECRRSEELL